MRHGGSLRIPATCSFAVVSRQCVAVCCTPVPLRLAGMLRLCRLMTCVCDTHQPKQARALSALWGSVSSVLQ